MKYFLILVLILLLNCLQAKKGPFDSTTSSGAIFNLVIPSTGGNISASQTSGTAVGGPCGTNCFYEYTIPSYTIPGSSKYFLVPGGINSGKILVMIGGTPVAYYFDPVTNTSTAAPNMNAPVGLGNQFIQVPSGIHFGKYFTVYGNIGLNTSLLDLNTGIFTNTGSFSSGVNDATSFYISSGVHAGKVLVARGQTSNITYLADLNLASVPMNNGPALTRNTNSGALAFTISSDTHSGKTLYMHGAISSTSSLYDPANGTFSTGPNATCAVASHSAYYQF